jgi:type II secretory pathway pseudopilin PulG
MLKAPGKIRAREDGQGLVELIVALTVLAIGIGALLTILTSSALSLQRSGQKGTALALAEKQIELYRNLTYGDIRLDAVALASPTVDNVYKNASLSDPNIPAATGERTDTDAGTNPCDDTAPPPECLPVQYVGPGTATATPDHRKYRIDTYLHEVTPPSGGDKVARVYVVVRNAQVSTFPILARSASTISAINIANQNGKSIVTMAFSAQRAALQNTSPDTGAITATLSGGTNETGQINFYALAPPATPSPPCPTGWQQVDTVNVSGDGSYHPSAAALAAFKFTSTGTYYWYAAYTGDPLNKKASSICGATTQSTTVRTAKLSPTVALTSAANAIVNQDIPGSSLTATIAGSSGYTPNTMTLMAYGPSATPPPSGSCTTSAGGLWRSAGSVGPNGDGSYSPSATFKPTTVGRYWWYASYPADGTNNGMSSRCDGSTSIAHIDVTIPPDTFSLVSLTGASQTAGTPFNVRITAILPDGSGPDTAYAGVQTLTYTGPATSPKGNAPTYSSATFVAGVATVSVTLFTAQTASITATQGLVTGTSAPITVQAKATSGFSIASALNVTTVATQTAGTAFGVTLTAIDPYGNPSTDYANGNHSITWSGPGNAPNGQAPQYGAAATTVSFSSGVGTAANIALYNASTSTVLTAKETTTTVQGSSQPFIVKGGAPTTMAFINCSMPTTANSRCTGQPISIGNKTMNANVGLLDPWGNPASATAPVSIDLSSSGNGVTVSTPVNVPQGSTQSTQLTITGNNASATITAHVAAGGFADAKLTVAK